MLSLKDTSHSPCTRFDHPHVPRNRGQIRGWPLGRTPAFTHSQTPAQKNQMLLAGSASPAVPPLLVAPILLKRALSCPFLRH